MNEENIFCECPKCGSQLELPQAMVGETVECPACSTNFVALSQDEVDMTNEETPADMLKDISDEDTKLDSSKKERAEGSAVNSSTGVIDLSNVQTVTTDDELSCSTVKIKRKSVGMVPKADKNEKFGYVQSTQNLNLDKMEILKSAPAPKKKWWQFWK